MEMCSRCHKVLDEFKIEIEFNIKVNRMKESSVWEYIPNLDNKSREVLCFDCFNKFAGVMSDTMNIKYDKDESENC